MIVGAKVILITFVLSQMYSHSAPAQQYAWRKKFSGVGTSAGIDPLNPGSMFAEGDAVKLSLFQSKLEDSRNLTLKG